MLGNNELVFAVVINDSDYFMAVNKVGGGSFGTAYTCEDWTWTLFGEDEFEVKSGEFHICAASYHWDAVSRVNTMIEDGTIDPSNVSEQVDKGMDLLSRIIPNWRKLVDVDMIDLASVRWCILGQIFGNYSVGSEILSNVESDFDEEEYGFCADGNTSNATLTDEWTRRLS